MDYIEMFLSLKNSEMKSLKSQLINLSHEGFD